MRDTIRNTVKEVYNTNVKNIGSTSEVVQSPLPESTFYNVNKNVGDYINNTNNSNNSATSRIESTNHSSYSYLLLFLVFLLISVIVGLFYYYREDIKKYLNNFFEEDKNGSKESKTVSEKQDEVIEKDKLTIKKDGGVVVDKNNVKEIKKEQQEKPETKSKKNESIKNNYPRNQIVSRNDMYCYIGQDDNMRQCIEVFKDDICTSGDIFNRIDECLVPRGGKEKK